jgi:hypothetical protein
MEENKIFIDSDWKEQAQKEKEQLIEQSAQSENEEENLSFLDVINTFVMQTAAGLGQVATPDGQMFPPNPEMAAHNLEALEILQDKTEGNLTEEEDQVLSQAIADLQSAFVQIFGVDIVENNDE